MDTEQPLFMFQIMDGYSFRNTMGIIKSEIEEATMIVSAQSVEISFLNSSRCGVHNITLHPQEFTIYRYNIRDEEGNLLPEYPIGFKTSEMFNTTKGIGKRDGIRLYWLLGDNKINVQPIKTSTKDPGRAAALFVKILPLEHKRYGTFTDKTEPNVKVQAKDFADLCSQAGTSKCSCLQIIGYPNGVEFKGILPNQAEAFISRFISQTQIINPKAPEKLANIDEIDSILKNFTFLENQSGPKLSLNIVQNEDFMAVKVPIATTKALSKIHNISSTGTMLKFFFVEGKPTRLESPIGTYGTYVISLRNINTRT